MGRTCGSISSTVTLVPSAANIAANSIPTTPPPMTARRAGTSLSSRIRSESIVSSAPFRGMREMPEPVAMTMSLALIASPSIVTCPLPERLACLGERVELGRLEQRLGRDASADQAGAAHAVLLHDGCRRAELRGPKRGDVAARAAADHDHVKRPSHRPHLYEPSNLIMSIRLWQTPSRMNPRQRRGPASAA